MARAGHLQPPQRQRQRCSSSGSRLAPGAFPAARKRIPSWSPGPLSGSPVAYGRCGNKCPEMAANRRRCCAQETFRGSRSSARNGNTEQVQYSRRPSPQQRPQPPAGDACVAASWATSVASAQPARRVAAHRCPMQYQGASSKNRINGRPVPTQCCGLGRRRRPRPGPVARRRRLSWMRSAALGIHIQRGASTSASRQPIPAGGGLAAGAASGVQDARAGWQPARAAAAAPPSARRRPAPTTPSVSPGMAGTGRVCQRRPRHPPW